jgi:hypothetical protein
VDFTEYVAARGRALWRAAWLLTGDAKLAEDLVQTALTKAWPALARGGPDTIAAGRAVGRPGSRLGPGPRFGRAVAPAARRRGPELLRGPDRDRHRGGPRLLGRHREGAPLPGDRAPAADPEALPIASSSSFLKQPHRHLADVHDHRPQARPHVLPGQLAGTPVRIGYAGESLLLLVHDATR